MLFLKAIGKCENKNIHYWICGQGPELDNLKELAQERNIEDRIHFLGFRTDIGGTTGKSGYSASGMSCNVNFDLPEVMASVEPSVVR